MSKTLKQVLWTRYDKTKMDYPIPVLNEEDIIASVKEWLELQRRKYHRQKSTQSRMVYYQVIDQLIGEL